MYLTLVPFVSTADNNREAEVFVAGATPDDDLFFQTRTLLPVGVFEITKHPSVTISSNALSDMLAEMDRIRMVEEGTGHWMGLKREPHGGRGRRVPGGSHQPQPGQDQRLPAERRDDRARTGTQPEPAACGLRGPGTPGPDLPLRQRADGRVGVRSARRRVADAPRPGGSHELLRSGVGQRLLLHERAALPARGYGRGLAGGFPDPDRLGPRRRGRDTPPRPRLRRRDDARRAALRRAVRADRQAARMAANCSR